MSDPQRTREQAQARAQTHFKSAARREETARAEIAKERAAVDTKTAKLKALRLAKEAEDRVAAEQDAAAAAEKKAATAAAKLRRKAAAKPKNGA